MRDEIDFVCMKALKRLAGTKSTKISNALAVIPVFPIGLPSFRAHFIEGIGLLFHYKIWVGSFKVLQEISPCSRPRDRIEFPHGSLAALPAFYYS